MFKGGGRDGRRPPRREEGPYDARQPYRNRQLDVDLLLSVERDRADQNDYCGCRQDGSCRFLDKHPHVVREEVDGEDPCPSAGHVRESTRDDPEDEDYQSEK